jgi:hypothetical protein
MTSSISNTASYELNSTITDSNIQEITQESTNNPAYPNNIETIPDNLTGKII